MNNGNFIRSDYEEVRPLLDDENTLHGSRFLRGELGKRHLEEFRMWLDGATYQSIADTFKISREMARQDVRKAARILMNMRLDGLEKEELSNIDKFYIYIRKTAHDKGIDKRYIRAANCFIRSQKDWDHTDFLKALRDTDIGDILMLKGVGAIGAAVLVAAHNRLIDEYVEPVPDYKKYPVNHRPELRAFLQNVADKYGYTMNHVTRAENCFVRNTKGFAPDYLQELKDADPDTFITWRNAGAKTVEFLRRAHDELNREEI